jgi:hypothetical protein
MSSTSFSPLLGQPDLKYFSSFSGTEPVSSIERAVKA